MAAPGAAVRSAARVGVRLEIVTVVWMVAEATLAIGAGVVARSVLLTAFGADSVIELLSGGLLLWRYAGFSTARQLVLWMPFGVLFPLWFFRYSRSLWLALEYTLNPEP